MKKSTAMFPYCRVPTHITALYVFTVINFLVLFHVTIVQAEVSVLIQKTEKEIARMDDKPARFGQRIDIEGFEVLLAVSNPINGCSPVQIAPQNGSWVLLIRQSNRTPQDDCKFVDKVRNAQNARYQAAIIYNYKSNDLVYMEGDSTSGDLIPSVFIGLSDALELKARYLNSSKYKIRIWELNDNFNIMNYLIAFACIMGFIFLVTVTTLIVRFVRDLQQRRRRQLSPQHLKSLPVKKFEKGDIQYETCAICLEDYLEGDKLRILPCAHAYHTKCIDPWLTKNKRTCPVCKRKVFSEGEVPGSDDDSDDDERTPLLPQHGNRLTGGNTFGASGNSDPMPPLDYFFDDDDDVVSTDADTENGSEASGGAPRHVTNVTTASILPSSAGGSINVDDDDVIVALAPNRSHRRTENSLVQIGIEATDRPTPQQEPTSNKDNVMVV